jgi:hypothetical protein
VPGLAQVRQDAAVAGKQAVKAVLVVAHPVAVLLAVPVAVAVPVGRAAGPLRVLLAAPVAVPSAGGSQRGQNVKNLSSSRLRLWAG